MICPHKKAAAFLVVLLVNILTERGDCIKLVETVLELCQVQEGAKKLPRLTKTWKMKEKHCQGQTIF